MSDAGMPLETSSKSRGANVSGRTWKVAKQPMRAKSKVVKNKRLTSWELKEQKRLEDKQFKERVKALKDEKAEEKQKRNQALKERREKKEEEERYEKMAVKMHAKKVERMRRREKRNKMLKER
ncbi:similar to Saccharomyces cerevisiae YGL029W CGR1 Protein involved in nucleolar integrity and processing of the pre-rRNA for the 60S ribosome subunit [Maudiozyma saulgeensis]|uniref:rRNA-processing protein n=1 Tax=Maudiozyma saulgeensis TaxID=1789683 RepID=A0A1X7R5N3_9SACH|nr:similar to Saccharomyces cerevisiae YGL029W CGR1 Protein involved in nucleolar integrity and processing of the pre-rRNA for the 60S ribosome subunit [Kazachstania saulgeensis]